MTFAAATTIAPLSMVSGCGVSINTLPYSSALLEESLAFMGSVEDQQPMALHSVLVRNPKDPFSPWRDSIEILRRCEDIILFLASITLVIPDSPLALPHPILWHPPDKGIILVEVFGGIRIRLAPVLEASLTVRWYIYVDNNQVYTRVARHHFHQLMVLYPHQLYPTVICGCFACLPRDITFISEVDLRHLGLVDMVIAGWPCQGHSRVGAGRGLEDPWSSDGFIITYWW